MATTLQAKIDSLGEKLREENKSRECGLLDKDEERSTCPRKPLLSLDFATSTRQSKPGKWIEVVYATMTKINSISSVFLFACVEFVCFAGKLNAD